MRDKGRATFVLAVCVVCAMVATSSRTLARQSMSAAQAKEFVKDGKGCTMPEDAFYTRGAYAMHNGYQYHCVEIFGENLKPAGSAWILVEQ
jgi:hypothetical protein